MADGLDLIFSNKKLVQRFGSIEDFQWVEGYTSHSKESTDGLLLLKFFMMKGRISDPCAIREPDGTEKCMRRQLLQEKMDTWKDPHQYQCF